MEMQTKMKIMLVDDLPDLVRLYAERLEKGGHTVAIMYNMTSAYRTIKKHREEKKPFDLVIIDLMLKRLEPEFDKEQKKVDAALSAARFPSIASGQAFGLRLWAEQPRTPYCYLSAHSGLWMAGLDGEFEGVTKEEREELLVIDKDSLRLNTLEETLKKVIDLWEGKGWVDSTSG